MQNSFAVYDWLIIGSYFFVLLYLSFRKKESDNEVDYILAGRTLTLPAFVATLVSSWYGGILGVGEYSYLYGISNWVVFGLPYYFYAIIFALFFAEKIRESNLLTIPDQFQLHFGKGPAIISGLLLTIATLPAPYILMVGILINLLTGLNFIISLLVGTIFSLFYVYRGGFRMVVKTDIIQFLLMFTGFIILIVYLNLAEFPFWELAEKLPARYFNLTGGKSWMYIFAWYIIASQTLIDPNFYQRCYAAKSPKSAKTGILISILFWMLFDFLTTTAGLYSRVLLSESITPSNAYPLLGIQFLPVVLKGIFFTALLATIMSTVDSFSFVSAISLGRDTISRFRNKMSDKNNNQIVKISLLIVSGISLLIILYEQSIINIWFKIGSITIPSLLIPILAVRIMKRPFRGGLIMAGMILSALLTAAGIIFTDLYAQSIGRLTFIEQPLYLGLLIIILFLSLSFSRKKPMK